MRTTAVPALAFVALLAAQEQHDIRVDVDLVTVACSVSDRGGAPVKNLKSQDFKLSDNGQPSEIRYFWHGDYHPSCLSADGNPTSLPRTNPIP